jgi:hypothetical protein
MKNQTFHFSEETEENERSFYKKPSGITKAAGRQAGNICHLTCTCMGNEQPRPETDIPIVTGLESSQVSQISERRIKMNEKDSVSDAIPQGRPALDGNKIRFVCLLGFRPQVST